MKLNDNELYQVLTGLSLRAAYVFSMYQDLNNPQYLLCFKLAKQFDNTLTDDKFLSWVKSDLATAIK